MRRIEPNAVRFADNIIAAFFTIILLTTLSFIKPYPLLKQSREGHHNMAINWQNKKAKPQDSALTKRYAEANPFVPENQPDETNLISTQDQQAAQPTPPEILKSTEVLPSNSGNSRNLKVISSTNSESSKPQLKKKAPMQLPRSGIPSKVPPVLSSVTAPQGWKLEAQEEFKDKKIINLSRISPSERIEKSNDNIAKLDQGHRPRPKLSPKLYSGPTLKKMRSATRVGRVAIECRLNPFGTYMQELLKAIETQWGELILNSYKYMQREQFSSEVTFYFTLLKNGRIKNLRQPPISRTDLLSTELCRQAIASRAPFGEWTDKMIQEFGSSDEISITFNYK